ncbi:hypothetical protein GGI04_004846, partial [Coemansia thaxteri]
DLVSEECKRDGLAAKASDGYLREAYRTDSGSTTEWGSFPDLSHSATGSSRVALADDTTAVPQYSDICSADQSMYWSNNSSCTTLPPLSLEQAGPHHDESHQNMAKPGFELDAGTHRFEFSFVLPPKMPSTITSQVGGIEYNLGACVRTRNTLGISGYSRARLPVHVVNLPTRLADTQAALPVADEAVFTKQIDEGWWAMVKLSTRTASPGDQVEVSACLSWPARCTYEAGTENLLDIVGVQLELTELTVYRSLTTGTVLKRIAVPVASNMPSRTASGAISDMTAIRATADIVHVASGESESKISAYEERLPTLRDESPAVRGLFNEEHRREFHLQVPRARDTSPKSGDTGGIHIDSRSAPVTVSHELEIKLVVFDKTTQKMHTIPFKSRVAVVPEAESFFLPAYSTSMLDMRVM